jgi:mono/diheme cytochrome c family protein
MTRSLLIVALAVALAASAAHAGDADGKAVYEQHCATCHGADGTGSPTMKSAFGAELNIAKPEIAGKKDEELAKVITEGKGKMPAAGKSLSPADKQAVIAYVKSLAK